MQLATLSGNLERGTPEAMAPTPGGNGPFILMMDDFSDPNSGWEDMSWEDGKVGYQDGGYLVEAYSEEDYMWGVAGVNYQDIRIEVDATVLKTPANGNDAFGVDCRIQENGEGYGFRISSDGNVAIVVNYGDEDVYLVEFFVSDAVYMDGRVNHLTAICQGNHLELLVNDTFVAEAYDDTYTSGDIALSVFSFEPEMVSVLFDDILIQELGNPSVYADAETPPSNTGDYALSIFNPTSKEVCHVYIVPSEDEFWGYDLLDENEVIKPGSERSFTGLAGGSMDVKVDTCQLLTLYEEYELDFSTISTITLQEPTLLKAYDFSDTQGWPAGVVDGGLISNSSADYYSIAVSEVEKLVAVTGGFKASDVTLMTDVTMVKRGNNGMGVYGVTCRVQPNGDGYFFAIRGDGQAAILKMTDGTHENLIPWEYSELIHAGIGANYIRADCVDSTLTLFVNGDFIDSIEDDSFKAGNTGLAVFSPAGQTTQADYDYLEIYEGY